METPTTRTDRAAEARAEAERRWHDRLERLERWPWFLHGVAWADANPKPHTITFDEVLHVCDNGVPSDEFEIVQVLEALGIEVEDDDE